MGRQMKFRFKRKEGVPVLTDSEYAGYEATVNVAGWSTPQVLTVALDADIFGDFLGDQGADGTLELRLVDDAGNKGEALSKIFSLPDTIPPGTPDDVFDVEITGEDLPTP